MKLKIDNEAIAEEFFEDSLLLGIVAPIKDYQFSWQLNQLLGLGFRVNNDIEIQLTKKQRKYFFSIYEYAVPAISLTHYLYNNENDESYPSNKNDKPHHLFFFLVRQHSNTDRPCSVIFRLSCSRSKQKRPGEKKGTASEGHRIHQPAA